MNTCTDKINHPTDVRVAFPRLYSATFIRRLNRFAAEIRLDEPVGDGDFQKEMTVIAHVPSSGRMTELLFQGSEIRVSKVSRATRKTAFTVILVKHNGGWVCVDSHLPNKLVHQGLSKGQITVGLKITDIHPEAAYGASRLDFIIEAETGHVLIEVKSVTLVVDGVGKFPDAPTSRGVKQLYDIARGVQAGLSGLVLFIIQRSDARCFTPNDETDPDFGAALRYLYNLGAVVKAFRCEVDETGITLLGEVPPLL